MTWAERFPPPGPMPPQPDPDDLTQVKAVATFNAWVKANRKHMVAVAVDKLKTEALASDAEGRPTDVIAFVVGTAFLDGSLEPGLFGGLF